MRYLLLSALVIAGCATRQPITYNDAHAASAADICMAVVLPQVTPQERAVMAKALRDRGENCDAYKTAMQAQIAANQQSEANRAAGMAVGMQLLNAGQARTLGPAPSMPVSCFSRPALGGATWTNCQ